VTFVSRAPGKPGTARTQGTRQAEVGIFWILRENAELCSSAKARANYIVTFSGFCTFLRLSRFVQPGARGLSRWWQPGGACTPARVAGGRRRKAIRDGMRYSEIALRQGLSGQDHSRSSHGRLAQRESASFTPRRSLVRSQYRPHWSAFGVRTSTRTAARFERSTGRSPSAKPPPLGVPRCAVAGGSCAPASLRRPTTPSSWRWSTGSTARAARAGVCRQVALRRARRDDLGRAVAYQRDRCPALGPDRDSLPASQGAVQLRVFPWEQQTGEAWCYRAASSGTYTPARNGFNQRLPTAKAPQESRRSEAS
jgi:hypothetical protein